MENFSSIVSPEGNEVKGDAETSLEEWRQEGMEPVEGELEKTETEEKYIEVVNKFITRLYNYCGIKESDNNILSLDQVHILPGNLYKEKFPHLKEMGAHFNSTTQAIYLNRDARPADESLAEINKFETLLHESLHLASHQKFYLKNKTIKDYRVGYRLGDVNKKGRNFEGFNEGVVVLTELDLLRSFDDELEEEFGFTQEDIETSPIYGYQNNQALVERIASKIADYRDEDIIQSFGRIMRGHFTGEMMHLRDIEKVYGQDSLKILARYGDKKAGQHDDIILEYFESADESRRDEIKEEILG